MNPYYLMSIVAAMAAVALIWWLARRQGPVERPEQPAERLDTLIGWPPEQTRVLRSTERLAFSTLKLALPGYMILAQVQVARFLTVPKRNSHAEWMRRIGSQCVDFLICDVTSQVVGVVEVRPPGIQPNERLRIRQERLARSLTAAHIPLHVWNEEKLPTIEAAREKILPNAPAVPAHLTKKPAPVAGSVAAAGLAVAAAEGAVAIPTPGVNPFADTDRDWTQDEVIEVLEPSNNTWYDDMESVSAELPPPEQR
jgi:hypothetical protein